MTGILALACLITGFTTGWLMRTIMVMAQISRSQERMQRRVRYWQGEAARARAIADRLARRLAASTGLPQEDQDWPPADQR